MYSFEKLCVSHYQELLAYAIRRTGDKAKAEDIVQEAVARALGAWDRWEPQGEPSVYARAWMFRCVSNTFATSFSRDKTFNRLISNPEGSEANLVAEQLYQSVTSEHPYAHSDGLGDEVREALDRIKPEWASVVKLIYVEGMSERKVAEVLQIAPGTVRSRMARGRLALARILSPYAKQRFGYEVKPEAEQVYG